MVSDYLGSAIGTSDLGRISALIPIGATQEKGRIANRSINSKPKRLKVGCLGLTPNTRETHD